MKKSQKQTDILNSAEKLFTAYGYKKVSIDEIAKKAGIAKGTFYLYFKNKDDLYCQILEKYKEMGQECIKEMVQKVADIRTRLYIKFIGALHFFNKNKILKEILLENENYFSESITKKVVMEENLKHLVLLFGKDIKKIRADIELVTISQIYTFFLSILRSEQDHSSENLDFFEKLAKVLIDGILSQEKWEKQNYTDIFQTVQKMDLCKL